MKQKVSVIIIILIILFSVGITSCQNQNEIIQTEVAPAEITPKPEGTAHTENVEHEHGQNNFQHDESLNLPEISDYSIKTLELAGVMLDAKIPNNDNWIAPYYELMLQDKDVFIDEFIYAFLQEELIFTLDTQAKHEIVSIALLIFNEIRQSDTGDMRKWMNENPVELADDNQTIIEQSIKDNNYTIYEFDSNDKIPISYSIYIPGTTNPNETINVLLDPVLEGVTLRESSRKIATELGCIIIIVDFNYNEEPKQNFYTNMPYFTKGFYDSSYVQDEYLYPHKILEKIIDEAHSFLQDMGLKMEKRVLIHGFSGGAIFAQRFAVLSPHYVKAIAAGQTGGIYLLPYKSLDGYVLNYPLGISNYNELSDDNTEWDEDAYKEIYQFLYTGNLDSDCPAILDFIREEEDFRFLINRYGIYDTERTYNQANEMTQNGYNRIFFTMFDSTDLEYAERIDNSYHTPLKDKYILSFFSRVLDGTIDNHRLEFETQKSDVEKLLLSKPFIENKIELFDFLSEFLE